MMIRIAAWLMVFLINTNIAGVVFSLSLLDVNDGVAGILGFLGMCVSVLWWALGMVDMFMGKGPCVEIFRIAINLDANNIKDVETSTFISPDMKEHLFVSEFQVTDSKGLARVHVMGAMCDTYMGYMKARKTSVSGYKHVYGGGWKEKYFSPHVMDFISSPGHIVMESLTYLMIKNKLRCVIDIRDL